LNTPSCQVFSAKQILHAERQPFERPALAFRQPRIGFQRHGAGAIRRLQHESVGHARLFDRGDVGFGQFSRRKFAVAQRIARLRERKRGESLHPAVGSSHENGLLFFFSDTFAEASACCAPSSACTGNGCTGNAENSASTASGSSGFNRP
jgi:hypothetical protein